MYFEDNILYPREFKRDFIKIDSSREIHYLISTNQQQSRWHIAINLINTEDGSYVQRKDLSKVVTNYALLLEYVQVVKHNILQPKEVDKEFREDIASLQKLIKTLQNTMDSFERKYFG